LIAAACTLFFVRLRQAYQKEDEDQIESLGMSRAFGSFITRFGGPASIVILSIAALSLFLAVNVLLYSSLFRNYPQGLYDAIKTFQFWTKTGTQVHVHPWHTYLVWMWRKESIVLLLGAAGIGMAMWLGRNAFAVFTSLWAFGLILAYSLIPYKTPWLILNFIVPLSIAAGYAVEGIYRRAKNTRWSILVVITGIVALGVSAYQAITLNFINYDDPRYVYVYAHTYREFLPMVEEITRAADLAGTGKETEISVMSPEYWPLPWYLRDYPRVKFYGRLTGSTDPIIMAQDSQEAALRAVLGSSYVMIRSSATPGGAFPLRPTVNLVLFVRSDLAKR
jgi:uncharacterized protein (TIGR03663 family)